MSLSDAEKIVLEALKYALKDRESLGLPPESEVDEDSHYQQHKFEEIEDMMYLKVNELTHADAVLAAFRKIHAYKYIDDKNFIESFIADLKSMAVPVSDQKKAVEALDSIKKELGKDGYDAERDVGWGKHIDDIADMTRNADDRKPEKSVPRNNEEYPRATEINAKYEEI